jgi:hypothetical protein
VRTVAAETFARDDPPATARSNFDFSALHYRA